MCKLLCTHMLPDDWEKKQKKKKEAAKKSKKKETGDDELPFGVANVNITDNSDNTPLHMASERWWIGGEIYDMLKSLGADDTAVNVLGGVPVHPRDMIFEKFMTWGPLIVGVPILLGIYLWR